MIKLSVLYFVGYLCQEYKKISLYEALKIIKRSIRMIEQMFSGHVKERKKKKEGYKYNKKRIIIEITKPSRQRPMQWNKQS